MESNTSPQREEIPKYEQSMTSSMHLVAKWTIPKIQYKYIMRLVAKSLIAKVGHPTRKFKKVHIRENFQKRPQFLHENSRQAAKWNLEPERKCNFNYFDGWCMT